MAKEKVVYSCVSSDGKVIRWSCDPTDLDDRPTTVVVNRSEQAFNARTIYSSIHKDEPPPPLYISCLYKGFDAFQHLQHKVSKEFNLMQRGIGIGERNDDEAFFNFLIKDDDE